VGGLDKYNTIMVSFLDLLCSPYDWIDLTLFIHLGPNPIKRNKLACHTNEKQQMLKIQCSKTINTLKSISAHNRQMFQLTNTLDQLPVYADTFCRWLRFVMAIS